MKHGPLAARIWAAAVCGISPICLAATMEFESVPVGTKYGAGFGNVPGQVVITENGIKMSVEQFFLRQFTGFFQAEVTGPANDHELAIDNISVLFDLTSLPFNVSSLTLQYSELGGEDNFSVNGGSILQLPDITNIPVNVAPGVTALVDGGRITLTGDIDRVLIGGQELSVDTVVAVPEPTSLLLLGAGGALLLRRLRRPVGTSRTSPR
ncbi:MAG: PEP-CTERM sorting domain-containing protein [Planctomycetota bacterium]